MFKLAKNSSEPIINPSVPAGTKAYVIGDIHGRIDLVKNLHHFICEDIKKSRQQKYYVIYLGDYIDRGDASKEVLDYLITNPLSNVEQIFLKGNHEQALVDFIKNKDNLDWINIGAMATLYSYNVRVKPELKIADKIAFLHQAFVKLFPQKHLDFMLKLKRYFILGDYLFVHAGIHPQKTLAAQTDNDLFWIRDEFLLCNDIYPYIIVHGHTVTPDVQIFNNRIALDTGAFATNKLSCLILESDKIKIVDTLSIKE